MDRHGIIPEDLRQTLKENRSKVWDSYFEKWSSHCAEEDNDAETVFGVSQDVERAACSKCGKDTQVPLVYDWKTFLCEKCLISSSGHQYCRIRDCRICMKVANILSNRMGLISAFEKGAITNVKKKDYFLVQNTFKEKQRHH
ncbi:unnamed protein product [Lepeophtheirus salmonis]|uniref:(salmon louse) hypothetical protein n=1 Tax=Lepeophtheirus salmonis TaxID=72036 RepID=A0A0K2T1T1_LEPSM|nr:uncharacterized protein LOC121118650 [Lepeophtheirus salmonis]CAB4064608.1 unnamed protein product [Lepeophtheirus salmonis]CAF2944187.1 unnamed protein product [Lepeophtheirus salmonis]